MNRHRRFVLRRGAEEAEDVVVEALHEGRFRVRRGGRSEDLEARRLPDGRLSVLFEDGRQVAGRAVPRGAVMEVVTRRGVSRVALGDPLADLMARASSLPGGNDRHEEIRALMPGRVVQVSVKAGERVEQGSLLLVLEAMKMQNEIRAPLGGTVEEVRVVDGQLVEAGTVLLSVGD